MTRQRALSIRTQANEFRGALEEVIFLAVKQAISQDGGGYRHEQSKLRFSVAVENLVKAIEEPEP